MTAKSLSVEGHIEIAGRKWRRVLTLKRGGRPAELQVKMRGKAPGGFTTQIMQVDAYQFLQWCLHCLAWANRVREWEGYVQSVDLERARRELKKWKRTGSEEG